MYTKELRIRFRVRGNVESVVPAATLIRTHDGVAHLMLFDVYKHLHIDISHFESDATKTQCCKLKDVEEDRWLGVCEKTYLGSGRCTLESEYVLTPPCTFR